MKVLYVFLLFTCFIYLSCASFWASLQGSSSSDYSYGSCMINNFIYMAGYTNGQLNGVTNAGSSDGFIIKMDSLGNVSWTKLFGTAFSDGIFGVACDVTNNLVYATGYTGGALGGQTTLGSGDAFIVKVNGGDGTWISTKLLGSSSVDQGNAIAVDPSGNVYVTGYTYGSPAGCTGTNLGTEDVFVYKLDSSLNKVWCFLAGSSSSDYGNAIAVSDDGTKVAIAGGTFGSFYGFTNIGSSAAFYAVYDTSNGNKLYAGFIQTTSADVFNAVRFDNVSNVVVSGNVGATIDGLQGNGAADIYIAKCSSTGRIWSQLYGSSGADVSTALSINQDQTIAVTGRVSGSVWGKTYIGSTDFFWLVLGSDGSFINADIVGTTSGDYGLGITSNSLDMMIYVTGYTSGSLLGVINRGSNDALMFADCYYQAPVGYYAIRGSNSPIVCPIGTLCDVSGLRVPKNCSLGNYCPNVTISIPCSTGSYCPVNSTADTDCPIGYFCVNPSTRVACTSGSLCDTLRKIASSDCPIGSFCPNVTTAVTCIGGQLCNTSRLTSAGICPAGSTCANPSVAAVPCSLGSLCNATGLVQEPDCPIGYYCPNVTTSSLCTIGSLCNTTRLTINRDCPIGYYCPVITSSAIPCTIGSLCNTTRVTSDQDCPIGYYCPNITSNAILCEPGYYCNIARLSQPILCSIGNICPVYGMQSPTACSPGKLCNTMGLISEQECPAGNKCNSGVSSACSLGNYCPANSSTEIACQAGFYCPTPSSQLACNVGCSCASGSTSDCVVSSSSSSSTNSPSSSSSLASTGSSSSTGSSQSFSSSFSSTISSSTLFSSSGGSSSSSGSSPTTSSSSSSGSSSSTLTGSSSSTLTGSSTGTNITTTSDGNLGTQESSSSSVPITETKNFIIPVAIVGIFILLFGFYLGSRWGNKCIGFLCCFTSTNTVPKEGQTNSTVELGTKV